MPLEATLADHKAELIARLSKTYALADGAPLAEMIDALVWHNVPVEPGASVAGPAQSSWSRTVLAAQPSRRAMQLAANRFGEWLKRATPVSQPAVLEWLPSLAGSLPDLEPEGVGVIVDAASQCTTPEDARRVMKAIGAYGEMGKKVLLPIARFLAAAAKAGEVAWAEPMEAMAQTAMEDPDSGKFFAAFPAWDELPQIYGPQHWRPALALVFAAAAQSCSSASHLMGELPKTLRRMDDTRRTAYLADFLTLVKTVGIQVVGFNLDTVPAMYEKYGVDRMHEFLAAGAASAELYGKTAGEWFLERKTRAARQFLEQ
jgi:hypothetical protein